MTATDDPAAPTPGRNRSQSVRRALALLGYVEAGGPDGGGATLAEISAGLGLNKSTALRLLEPLREFGLVEQDAATGRFDLGSRAATLGQAFLSRLDLRAIAQPELRRLVEASGETAHLVIYDHPEVVYVDKLESPSPVRMHSEIGKRMPAHSTATGKVFLAHLGEKPVREVIAAGLEQRTERTLTDGAAFRAELDAVRERGWAGDDVENEEGVRCAAAPVFDHTGAVRAAVSVSGPTMRVPRERLSELGALVRDTARSVSERLGAVPAERAGSSE
jgi:DNA-binding IclR family transcriptional regulator